MNSAAWLFNCSSCRLFVTWCFLAVFNLLEPKFFLNYPWPENEWGGSQTCLFIDLDWWIGPDMPRQSKILGRNKLIVNDLKFPCQTIWYNWQIDMNYFVRSFKILLSGKTLRVVLLKRVSNCNRILFDSINIT